jgi:hypothetical protein
MRTNYHCPAHFGFARWCRDCIYYSNTLRAVDKLQRNDPTLARERALETVEEGIPDWRRISNPQGG